MTAVSATGSRYASAIGDAVGVVVTGAAGCVGGAAMPRKRARIDSRSSDGDGAGGAGVMPDGMTLGETPMLAWGMSGVAETGVAAAACGFAKMPSESAFDTSTTSCLNSFGEAGSRLFTGDSSTSGSAMPAVGDSLRVASAGAAAGLGAGVFVSIATSFAYVRIYCDGSSGFTNVVSRVRAGRGADAASAGVGLFASSGFIHIYSTRGGSLWEPPRVHFRAFGARRDFPIPCR